MGPFGLFPPFRAIRPTRPMPAPPPPHYVPSVDGLPPLDALDQAHQVNRAAATRQLRTPVLVVDDSPDVRLTVCQLLTLAGYVVVEAPEGRSGLQVLRSAPARVVALLDLVMPVLDGAGRACCGWSRTIRITWPSMPTCC